nr:hypothetical protein [Tanacetum cinerariifolium]
MARLQICDYHNMVAILEKGEFNSDFHPMVDFIAASPLRIVPLFDTMLVHQGEGSGTPTEPHHTPLPEAETSHPTTSSIPLPSIPTALIPPVTQPDPTPIRQYTKRARIAQSSALPTVADKPASTVRDVSKGEACPTDSSFIADQDRATIANLQRQYSELLVKFQAQGEDIVILKERVQVLEDREVKVVATARRLEMPLPEVFTAIEEKKKKLPVKDRWQLLPLPVKVVATARRLEMPLPEVFTAIEEKKKKLPVKDRWQLH